MGGEGTRVRSSADPVEDDGGQVESARHTKLTTLRGYPGDEVANAWFVAVLDVSTGNHPTCRERVSFPSLSIGARLLSRTLAESNEVEAPLEVHVVLDLLAKELELVVHSHEHRVLDTVADLCIVDVDPRKSARNKVDYMVKVGLVGGNAVHQYDRGPLGTCRRGKEQMMRKQNIGYLCFKDCDTIGGSQKGQEDEARPHGVHDKGVLGLVNLF